MFSSENLIISLSKKIDEVLQPLIPAGTNCALLEFPNYSNVGDSAIWLAEKKWLRKNRNPIVYTCAKETYSADKLAERIGTGIILLQGGGNFGDIWGDFQHFHEQVIQDFPGNKIIQFPQSIYFKHETNLARTRKIVNAHRDLTLLCRDKQSFDFAQKEFTVQSILCPDIVFSLGILDRPCLPQTDIVWLSRTDKETLNQPAPSNLPGIKRTDWLEESHTNYHKKLQHLTQELKVNPENWHLRYESLYDTYEHLAKERFSRGCNILSEGKVVVTDRLHGHVLCLLMDIPHIALDNKYGKVKGLYETWTKDNGISIWANSPEEVVNAVLPGLQFQSILKSKGIQVSAFETISEQLKTSMNRAGWTTTEADAKALWTHRSDQVKQNILALVPDGQTVILVDEDLLRNELDLKNRFIIPFSERNGTYWGPPKDSETAIREFELKRQEQKVDYIAFAWPSFWWLDHYAAFHRYLRGQCNCVLEDNCVVLFNIK